MVVQDGARAMPQGPHKRRFGSAMTWRPSTNITYFIFIFYCRPLWSFVVLYFFVLSWRHLADMGLPIGPMDLNGPFLSFLSLGIRVPYVAYIYRPFPPSDDKDDENDVGVFSCA